MKETALLTFFDYLRNRARDSIIEGVREAAAMLERTPAAELIDIHHNKIKNNNSSNQNNKQEQLLPTPSLTKDRAAPEQPSSPAPKNDEDRPPRRRGRPKKRSAP